MRRMILIITFCMILQALVCINIEEITNISYRNTPFDYDTHLGSINRYNNRLIVQNLFKIEEYLIDSSGNLERIFFYETKDSFIIPTIIANDMYFCFQSESLEKSILVFTLTVTPMQLIETVSLPVDFAYFFTPQLVGNHIYIQESQNNTLRFNINTLTFDESLTNLFGFFVVHEDTFIVPFYYVIDDVIEDYVLRFYDFNTASEDLPYGEIITELFLEMEMTDFPPVRLKVEDDKLYILSHNYIAVYDITDINNINILMSYSTNNDFSFNIAFSDAVLIEDKMIAYSNKNILFLNIIDQDNVEILYEETKVNSSICYNPINYNGSDVYINTGTELKHYIFEEIPEFVASYGKNRQNFYTYNEYVLEKKPNEDIITITSLLDLDNTFDISKEAGVNHFYKFYIDDELLILFEKHNEVSILEIYNVDNNSVTLVTNLSLDGFFVSRIYKFNDFVLIYDNNLKLSRVFSFQENNLIYIGEIQGIIESDTNVGLENYFIVVNNESVYLHSKQDPLNIDYSFTNYLNNIILVHTINENTLGLITLYNESRTLYFYNIDLANNELEYISEITYISIMTNYNFFNGIMSENSAYSQEQKYYSISQGVYQLLGEHLTNKSAYRTLFYPEQNIMVQFSYSGIDIYDIEYTVASSDQVVEYERETYVYPNPVNGGDVNFKTSIVDKDTEISIYNIKGQLVKTSKAFQTKDNESIFTWDKRNNQNQNVASGVYFYKIKTDSQIKTGKFLIMK
ncbi:MAG: T9SS type A sorting domain-containing protein [Candidatus Cloacimonetes bacterium]|nr:T9SS type A sorting domain-containing protein [Candidatus Cloacimonadota bacterium]